MKAIAPRSLPKRVGDGDRPTGDDAPELGGDGTVSSVGGDDWPTGDGELGGAGPGAAPGARRRANRAARPAGLKLPKRVGAELPRRVGDDKPELVGDASPGGSKRVGDASPGAGGAGAGCTRAAGAGRGSADAMREAAPRLRRPADRRGDGRPWPGLPSGILLASMRAGPGLR